MLTTAERPPAGPELELSLVIPVYNGSQTITAVVQEIETRFAGAHSSKPFWLTTARMMKAKPSALAKKYSKTVTLVQLSRNFGEHNAVLAGLGVASRGRYVAVLR